MTFWSRLQAFFIPDSFQDRYTLEEIREALLIVILRVSCLFGMLALLTNLSSMLENRAWGYLAIYALVAAWLIFIAFTKRVPYHLKVVSVVGILYVLGTSASLQFATAGDGRIWLLGTVVVSTLFLGLGFGLVATLFSTITLLFIGALMTYQIIPPPVFTKVGLPGEFTTWLTTSTSYLVISVVLVSSIAALVNTLGHTSKKYQNTALELEEKHQRDLTYTTQMEHRQEQLYIAAEISAILGRAPTLDSLLTTVVNLLRERFQLYYCGVFLIDEQGLYAILYAGTGEAGKKMHIAGHKLAIGGSSMIGWCIANRKARIALDTGVEAIRFNNPLLPLTRSELALPIMLGDQVWGALTIQSERPNAFDQTDITILENIANSLATAINNVQLVQQLQRSLEQVQRFNQQYLITAWQHRTTLGQKLEHELENPLAANVISETRTMRIPLTLRGVTIGEVTLEGGQPWDENDRAFAQAIATQTAQALENARLVSETLQQAQREQVVTTITEQVRASLDMETILRISASEIQRALRLQRVRIQLREDTSNQKTT